MSSRNMTPGIAHSRRLSQILAIVPALIVVVLAGIAAVAAGQGHSAPAAPAAAVVIPVVASDDLFEDHVLVSWPAKNQSNIFYRVKRNGTLLTVLPGQASSYQDLAGTPGVTYNYCVAEIHVATGDTIDLGCDNGSRRINPPTGMSATDGTLETGVRLFWSDRSFIETGYRIRRDNALLATIAPNSEAWTDTSAVAGTTYNYCVDAVDANGNLSAAACNTGVRAAIQAPGGVSATDGQDPVRVLVTWTDETDKEVGFAVRRRVGAGPVTALGTTNVNATQFADSTAVPGVVYTYCVTALGTSNEESAPACDEGNRGLLPPPAGVAATDNVYDDRVTITWQDPSATEDGFRIYRIQAAPADTTFLGEVDRNRTTFDDLDAEPGRTYQYCVQAFTDLGAYSTWVCDSGRRAIVLAPGNVQASDGTYEDVVEITWESEATSVVLFKIFRDGVPIMTVPATQRSALDDGTAPGITHTWSVAAVTAFEDASILASDTGFRLLHPPTDVAAGDFDNEVHVMVTWSDNSSFESGYKIYRRIGNAVPTLLGTRAANRTAYLDSTGTPGQEYEYSVAAYDALGNSTTAADDGGRSIKAPTQVEATDGTFENRIVVSWVDNARFEAGYRVYRRLPGAPDSALVGATAANVATFTDTSVKFGVAYEYIVKAYDNYGSSPVGRDQGFTVIQPPPTVLATDTYPDSVRVTWIDASGIESGYRIYRDGVLQHTTLANQTAWTDLAATQGVTYEYCVRTFVLDNAVYTYSTETCDDGIRATPTVAVGLPVKTLTTTLPTSGLVSDTHYGQSIAMDGDYALVGAPYGLTSGSEGSVYAYKWDGTAWVETDHFYAPTNPLVLAPGNAFGMSVAISGDRAVVGAPGTTIDNINPSGSDFAWIGAVYVFERDSNDDWVFQQLLLPGTFEVAGSFGENVAIDGTNLVVGSTNTDSNSRTTGGAAWIYAEDSSGDFVLDQKIDQDWLIARNKPAGYKLGSSVGVSDGYFLVGYEEADPSSSGAVFQYRRTSSNSIEYEIVQLPGMPGSASFGEGLAVQGAEAIVGAPGLERAYVMTRGSQWWAVGPELSPGESAPGFGRTVAMNGNHALVSAQNAYYAFRKDADSGQWNLIQKFPIAGNGTGYAPPGVSGNLALFGAPDQNSNAGAVYFDQFLVGPANLTASDATYETRVLVKWKDKSQNEAGFRIYRDGLLLDDLSPNTTSYSDFEAEPGRVHEYCVIAFNDFTESARVCDYGLIPPDGNITGRIATRNGTAVEGVDVCLDPSPSLSLLFDGGTGAVAAPTTNLPALTAFTIEYWARTGDGRPGTVLSYADAGSNTAILIREFGAPRLQIGSASFTSGALNLNDNIWHHYAWTWASGTGAATLYVDGVERAVGTLAAGTTIAAGGYTVLGQEQGTPGGGFNAARSFQGQLDDLRIWNAVRTPADIAASRSLRLGGAEENLALYWPMDEGANTVVADETAGGTYATLLSGVAWSGNTAPVNVCGLTDSEGNYVLPEVRYGTSTTFRVTPSYPNRQFEPAFKTITLNTDNPVQNEVAFNDISSYTIEGFVRFQGNDLEGDAYLCPVGEVEILIDGALRGTTGPDGKYSIPVDLGTHEITARSGTHVFSPASRSLFIGSDASGLDFADLTRHTLSGIAAGGCNLPIGTVDYEIRSESSCFVIEDDTDGAWSQLLPAQKYTARVIDVTLPAGSPLDRADILEFFENVGPKTVDLRNEDATLDFIYHAPLVIEVEGFTDPTCATLTVPGSAIPLPAVPLVEQSESVPLIIRVFEDYGSAGLCPVDSGRVTVFDEIIDEGDTPVPLNLVNGEVQYTTIGNTPNIFAGRRDSDGNDRSYQKPISFVAEVEGQAPVTLTRWVIVTGQRPRVATFTSVSEEIPLLILRDPPGDASSAFIETGTTICNTINNIGLENLTTGINLRVKTGLQFDKGTPFFTTTTKARVETENSFRFGFEATQDDGISICATTLERISTSSSDQFVDNRGDVYMGVALNLIFAKTDVVEVTEAGGTCALAKSESVTMGGEGFETTYLYSEEHIRAVLIPQNEELADLTGDAYYQSAADNWRAHIALNDSLKAAATFSKNRSFSAGADYDYSSSSDTTGSFAYSTKLFTNDEVAIGFNFEESGSGSRFQAVVGLGFEWTRTEVSDTSRTRTVGYTLSDDDIYDYFTFDVKDDAFYGTPVFDVLSGRSSCPWEPWYSPTTGEPRTQPRDGAVIAVEPPVQLDVDPEDVAHFVLTLTNDSPANETREYYLMPNQVTNTGGASIFVGGDTFIQLPFFIPAGESRTVDLTVARGPTLYNYDNIELVLIPTCEFDYWRATGFAQLADTVSFSVHFAAPCSDVTLFEPRPDWRFNAQDAVDTGNKLRLTLKDFELSLSETDSLESIGAEYRLVGTEDWFPISEILRSNIQVNADGSPRSNEILWNVASVVDGTYELRAFTRCPAGRAFSGSATGTIDRQAPLPLGAPQPADLVLSLGEEIAVTFNETIDCNSVTAERVALYRVKEDASLEPLQMTAVCAAKKIVVTPTNPSLDVLEGKKLRVHVEGITDRFGNPMTGPGNQPFVEWSFDVRRQVFAWSQIAVTKTAPYLDPGRVSAELVNGSDQTLEFSFTGLPAWLTPTPATGTIEPGEKLGIDFAIAASQAIGSWNATATAVAREGAVIKFEAPLAIHVDVVCVPPVWTLNTADFEQSMTLIAQVSIAGGPATTKDIVAAFVGNQLRGLGHPQVVAGRPDSLLYLTVYSNRTAGETVRFQFFDQSACRVFNSASKTYAFVADSRIGAPTLPEAITAADVPPGSPQTVPIDEGWTWISFNRLSALDMSVNGVLGDLNSSTGDLLKSQSAFSQFDEVAGWVGNVSVFNNLVGYMIRSSEAGQVVLEGNPVPPTQTDIPVVTGWNWISYLPTAELETNLALATLAPVNGDVIKGQEGFAQYVKTGSVSRWFGSLAKLTPGKGYKLFLSNASNTQNKFRYPNPPVAPSTVGIRQDADLGPLADSGNGPEWTVDPHLFQYNMTVTGALESVGAAAPAEGDMVAAFVDDELRGAAPLRDFPGEGRRMFFLMIHGNTPAGEAVRLEFYNAATDHIYKVDGTVAFEADRVVGNPALPWIGRVTGEAVEPPVVGNVPQAFSLAQNAPNPPNPLTTIRFAMPKSERVSMNVYDVAGRHVMTLVDGTLGAGWHEVTLDSQMFSSGLYFYRLEAGSFVQTQKLLIAR